jgi:hypothetical protein
MRMMWGRWDLETDLGSGSRTDLPLFSNNDTGQNSEGYGVIVSVSVPFPLPKDVWKEIDQAIGTKLDPEIERILNRFLVGVGMG